MKNFDFPADHKPYIDKYFLRAKEILVKDELNPIVKAQVFIRKGNCKLYGIDEAVACIYKYNPEPTNMVIYALQEGSEFKNGECLMTIEAPIQNIIDLETMYLGILSAETSEQNHDGLFSLECIEENMEIIVDLVKPRPVSYFGARHWRYNMDRMIAGACMLGGAKNCSTDAGAKAWGKDCEGIGTIPHALECIYHWKYGLKFAVYMSTSGFNEYMDKSIPRIALVDYANREIQDSLKVAPLVNGIRIDTCGENYMQGVNPLEYDKVWDKLTKNSARYLQGKGVSINGVYAVRKVLNDNGFEKVKIILSSGFGNPAKVQEFLDAEQLMDIKLFDSLGVGGVYESRMATMDIIEVDGKEIHKVGRLPKPTDRLRRVI